VHPATLAKVAKVILAPVKLIAAEALVCLTSMIAVITLLMLRR
jgi:hypothetical protein